MASVRRVLVAADGGVELAIVFNDANGDVTSLEWVVPFGGLVFTIGQTGKPEITRSVTADGSQAIPPAQRFVYDFTIYPPGSYPPGYSPLLYTAAWRLA